MRVNIITKGKVKDKDIRALYLLQHALDASTPRMKIVNLSFIADKMGYKLAKKQ